jgi:MoaA/NifB/PqqE/SkfB family radical SAM enzyme
MFQFKELKQIHLEITSKCQAGCPMCGRNRHGGLDNPWLTETSWTLEDYKTVMSPEVLSQIESVYFCGNYGDPLMNKDLIQMCRYTTEINPDVSIRIHTNGSIQNTNWWKELATVLPKNHSIVFGIDGLKDTNHLYRIGTFFDKIIENATAFINAGGTADWAFIVFRHNEHQVKEAEDFAKELGFRSFSKKNSNRFLLDSKFDVYNKEGKAVYQLEPPMENKIVFIDRNTIDNYKKIVDESEIECVAQGNKEIYIDAYKRVFPCCFIALTPYNYYDSSSEIYHIRTKVMDQYNTLVKDFGGIDKLDGTKQTVKEIINSNEYQTLWTKYWNNPKMITCARTCGKNKLSKPKDQFVKKGAFNG